MGRWGGGVAAAGHGLFPVAPVQGRWTCCFAHPPNQRPWKRYLAVASVCQSGPWRAGVPFASSDVLAAPLGLAQDRPMSLASTSSHPKPFSGSNVTSLLLCAACLRQLSGAIVCPALPCPALKNRDTSRMVRRGGYRSSAKKVRHKCALERDATWALAPAGI